VFRLKESIHIEAPIERCFLLSTSIDLVAQTLKLRPVEGKTTGAILDRDRVVWRGWKFGFPAFHETLITGYSRPSFFQDTMARGYFNYFQHDHHFHFIDGYTSVWDVVRCTFPLGYVGHQFGRKVVVPHIQHLLRSRHLLLKRLAEGDGWREYITDPADRALAERGTEEVSSGA
jgi:ligand-binding SRPBCC domain-containing protein